jgi:hypothetical protein
MSLTDESPISFPDFDGDEAISTLREGKAFVLLDPFTENERWVPADSPEGKLAEENAKKGKPFWITGIDYGKGTVTLSSAEPSSLAPAPAPSGPEPSATPTKR